MSEARRELESAVNAHVWMYQDGDLNWDSFSITNDDAKYLGEANQLPDDLDGGPVQVVITPLKEYSYLTNRVKLLDEQNDSFRNQLIEQDKELASLKSKLAEMERVLEGLVRISEDPSYRLSAERTDCHCGRKLCAEAHYFKIGVESPIIDDARAALAKGGK